MTAQPMNAIKADWAAKEASRRGQVVKLSSIVWREIGRNWQDKWERERRGKHLYRVQKKVRGMHTWGGSRSQQVLRSTIKRRI